VSKPTAPGEVTELGGEIVAAELAPEEVDRTVASGERR
jgi:hypothetical protein